MHTLAIMVISSVGPKGKTLELVIEKLNFSISAIILATWPFCFSQRILIRTSLSENLTSISGSSKPEEPSSQHEDEDD